MIRPAAFGYNEETAGNNIFQEKSSKSEQGLQEAVLKEFDRFVKKLRNHRIHVDVLQDIDPPYTPDAIFPNNWFSTHPNGFLVTYPMFAKLRRKERLFEHIEWIKQNYQVNGQLHIEEYEAADLFLEGTGSIVFDRGHNVAYASRSQRTNEELFRVVCKEMQFTPVIFDSIVNGQPVYHTNVIMALAQSFVVICLESIPEGVEKDELLHTLSSTDKEIIDISIEQVHQFAGNMLQVKNAMQTHYTVMSDNAFLSLNSDQIAVILDSSYIIHAPIPNIEQVGGGSVRCMIAENFLTSILE